MKPLGCRKRIGAWLNIPPRRIMKSFWKARDHGGHRALRLARCLNTTPNYGRVAGGNYDCGSPVTLKARQIEKQVTSLELQAVAA